MATSDSPLNVPNVTLAVARGAANSGGALTAEARRFTLNRTFEGTVGEQTYNGDGFDDAAGRTIFSSEQFSEGSTSGKCQLRLVDNEADGGAGGYGKWGGVMQWPNKLQEGDEIFIRFRMYYPSNFTHYTVGAGDRVKFLRIRSGKADNSNAGMLDLYWDSQASGTTYKHIKEVVDQWKNVASSANFPHLFDQWVTYNIHYIASADPSIGMSRFWRNGAFMNEFFHKTLSEPTDTLDYILLFTYWNGTVPQDQNCYTDDWLVSSDRGQTVIDPATGYPWLGP